MIYWQHISVLGSYMSDINWTVTPLKERSKKTITHHFFLSKTTCTFSNTSLKGSHFHNTAVGWEMETIDSKDLEPWYLELHVIWVQSMHYIIHLLAHFSYNIISVFSQFHKMLTTWLHFHTTSPETIIQYIMLHNFIPKL